MKITCTLSEYTKMARQCGETKARFNCRNCPLNGLLELPEGEKCDIERFVQAISMPESPLARELAKKKGISYPDEMETYVNPAMARGERLESR